MHVHTHTCILHYNGHDKHIYMNNSPAYVDVKYWTVFTVIILINEGELGYKHFHITVINKGTLCWNKVSAIVVIVRDSDMYCN